MSAFLVDLASRLLFDVDMGSRTVSDVLEIVADDAVLDSRPVARAVRNLAGVYRRRERDESPVEFVGTSHDALDPVE